MHLLSHKHKMIKHKKKDRIKTVPATISKDAYQASRLMFAPNLADGTRRQASNDRNIASSRRRMAEHVANIRDLMRSNKEIEETRKSYDWKEVDKQIKAQIKAIASLAFVDSIESRGNDLLINTNLFFVDIRASRADKKTTRTCIGAFAIKINLIKHRIRIHNTLFGKLNYPHWSIGIGGSPCWGDWSNDIGNALNRQNAAELVQILQPYLLSTQDGSAYLPCHDWKGRRNASLVSSRYREGSKVMASTTIDVETDYDEDGEEGNYIKIKTGMKGVVENAQDGYLRVLWDDRVRSKYYSDGSETTCHQHRLEVNKESVIALTADQYADPKCKALKDLPNANLKPVDELPEGSKLAEAKALLSKKTKS